jgi:hypothetical protein
LIRKWIVPTRIISISLVSSFVFVLLVFYINFGTNEENYNNILNPMKVFAHGQTQSPPTSQQEDDITSPVVKSSKIINFNGVNYADVLNSTDIILNGFTVSA